MKSCILFLPLLLLLCFLPSCDQGSETTSSELPSLKWRLASTFPRTTIIYSNINEFCENVSLLSDGKFQITPYQGGDLTSPLGVFDAVRSGAVEMGQSAGFYYSGIDKSLVFDTGIPFGLSSRQQNAWLYHGGGIDKLNKIYGKYGIKYFPCGNLGHQMGGWYNSKIDGVEDLKGLRIRIAGLGKEIFNELGATAIDLPGGEISTALETGAIDATEWIGPHDDMKAGFHKITNYYYYPNWWEPGTTVALYINSDKWESLPASYKAIIEVAAKAANLEMTSSFDHNNALALSQLSGIETLRFNDEIIDLARKSTNDYFEEISKSDTSFMNIYNDLMRYKETQEKWSSMEN